MACTGGSSRVRNHLSLAKTCARRTLGSGDLPWDDRVQECAIGILHAERTYDPSHGLPFMNWAIQKARFEVLSATRRAKKNPTSPLLVDPDVFNADSNAMGHLGLLKEAALHLQGPHGQDSIKARIVAQAAEKQQAQESQADDRLEVAGLLNSLPGLYRKVTVMRYGLDGAAPLDGPAIAKKLGISKQRVSTIERRALAILRQAAGVDKPETESEE